MGIDFAVTFYLLAAVAWVVWIGLCVAGAKVLAVVFEALGAFLFGLGAGWKWGRAGCPPPHQWLTEREKRDV